MATGNTSFGFDTLCIHGGHQPEQHRAHLTPIYASSTYTFDSAEQGVAIFKGEEDGYIYGRFGNPTIREAEAKIAALEDFGLNLGLIAILHASGMAAVTTLLLANLKAGDKIITHHSLYGGTQEMIDKILPDLGVTSIILDFHEPAAVKAAIDADPAIRMMYLESPANPTLQCIDLETLTAIGKAAGLLVCADNTFATPYLQQPFRYGVDMVMHSTTKFLNGHGTAVGGVLVYNAAGRDAWEQKLVKTHRLLGDIKHSAAVAGLAGIFWDSYQNLGLTAVDWGSPDKAPQAEFIWEMQSRQQAAGLRHRPEITTIFGVSQVAMFGFKDDKFRRRLWDDVVTGDQAYTLIDTSPGYFSDRYCFGSTGLDASRYFWLAGHRCVPGIGARPWSAPVHAEHSGSALPGSDQVQGFARVNHLYNRVVGHMHRMRVTATGDHVLWLDEKGAPAVIWAFADGSTPVNGVANDAESGARADSAGVLTFAAGRAYLLGGRTPADV